MKIKGPARDDVAVDMGPMIDLVFLLLIFFMVASVVADLDKAKVDIPKSSVAKVPENIQDRVTLSVDHEGQIYIGLRAVEMDELTEWLDEELTANNNLKVVIRADAQVQYKELKEIMAACGSVGATDLIYATFME